MNIAQGRVVAIHYTLTNDDGEILDSSNEGQPLSYLHGFAGLIPGLEKELEDRAEGDQLKATIAPEDAYGPVDPDLIHSVPLEALANIDNLSVGMRLQSQNEQGQTFALSVDEITDTHATLNANHELAGQTLHFDVKVENVREATEEELAHGHPH